MELSTTAYVASKPDRFLTKLYENPKRFMSKIGPLHGNRTMI